MMREILFRGKTESGEFAEGYYSETLRYNNLHWIWNGKEYVKIDPATVGQFTGLTDKNGKKIFEGDIIKNEYESGKYQYFKIVYGEKTLSWKVQNKYGMFGRLCHVIGNMEVIGNIHDNPELLEVSK